MGLATAPALIYSVFIPLGKVIKVLFMTQMPSSCLFDDASLLGRCAVFSDLPWVPCMALLGWLWSAESVSFSGMCE